MNSLVNANDKQHDNYENNCVYCMNSVHGHRQLTLVPHVEHHRLLVDSTTNKTLLG